MDCNNRETTNLVGEDSPLSHDEPSDHEDEIGDCDSEEEGNNNLNKSKILSIMDYGGGGNGGGGGGIDAGCSSGIDGRSPEHNITDIPLGHHSQFPTNHSLGALGNFIGIAGLHNLPNLQQHGDVLEKLKMQVRDMNAGLMEQEYPPHSEFSSNLTTPANTAFSVPPTSLNLSMFDYQKPRMLQLHSQSQSSSQSQQQQQQQQHQQQKHNSRLHLNGFSYTSPNISCTKDDLYAANPGSNSSASSEASNSSQQNNGWSFEEQYKQVRQLYEINDDPKRKEFLDDLFSFMQKRGTPINRLPIMAKSVLDLYELYNLVIARGGLVDVINKKLWQEIIKGLHLPSSITSAAFTLRTQYMKYLYPYECEKKNLSSPSELQAAIDGNRREGRRSSYGQFEAMHNQLQMPQMQRPNVPNSMQQISPLALVTHANQQSAAVAHHRLMAPPLGQMPNIVTHELEQRMMEYLKLFQTQQKDARRSQSPEITKFDALNALEMSRVALWSMYKNNTSPPSSVNTSPQGVEPQREALNLSDSPPNIAIKRERQHSDPPISEREDFNQPPPTKKVISSSSSSTTTQEVQQRENLSQLPCSTASSSGLYEDDRHINNNNEQQLINGNHYNHKNNNMGKKLTPLSSSPLKNRNGVHNEDFSFQSGMQFKVTRIENGVNGEQQLIVNLELNGMQYDGVLFANTGSSVTAIPLIPQSSLTTITATTTTTTTQATTTTTTAATTATTVTATTPSTNLSTHATSLVTNTTNRTLISTGKDPTLDDRTRSVISS